MDLKKRIFSKINQSSTLHRLRTFAHFLQHFWGSKKSKKSRLPRTWTDRFGQYLLRKIINEKYSNSQSFLPRLKINFWRKSAKIPNKLTNFFQLKSTEKNGPKNREKKWKIFGQNFKNRPRYGRHFCLRTDHTSVRPRPKCLKYLRPKIPKNKLGFFSRNDPKIFSKISSRKRTFSLYYKSHFGRGKSQAKFFRIGRKIAKISRHFRLL